jgi:vacuolar-type H+-ATPase subunit I/STV1
MNDKPDGPRWDLFISWVIGIVLIVILFWGVYEKRVQNDLMYLSPDQQVHLRERQFHQDLGALRGELHNLSQQVNEVKKSFVDLQKISGEATGRIDMMKEYFQKYSPETFEKSVKRLDDRFDHLENEIEEKYAQKLALEIIVKRYAHLPNPVEWEQFKKLSTEKFTKVEELLNKIFPDKKSKDIIEKKAKESSENKDSSKEEIIPIPGPAPS